MHPEPAIRVLLIETSACEFKSIEEVLSKVSAPACSIQQASSLHQALQLLPILGSSLEVILLALNLADSHGLDTFSRLLQVRSDLPVILLLDKSEEAWASEAIKMGAQDCLLKSELAPALLGRSILYAIERQQIRAELMRHSHSLSVGEERFRILVENASDAFFLHDEEGCFRDVNQQACSMLGYSRDELVSMSVRDIEEDFNPEAIKSIIASIIPGNPMTIYGIHKRKDGALIQVEIRVSTCTIKGQQMFLALVRDITSRKVQEDRIRQLTHLYAALNKCNEAIVRSTNEQELFLMVCQSAVQLGGMEMAWVGILDDQSLFFTPVASWGDDSGFLEGLEISGDPMRESGRGPVGISFREKNPFWCQDFQGDPLTNPWWGRAKAAGFKASASLPLYKNCKAVGVLVLYAGTSDAFHAESRELLIKMAEDISFALDNFARVAEIGLIQESLRQSEDLYRTLFNASTDAIFLVTCEPDAGRIMAVNEAGARMHGYTVEEMIGTRIQDVNTPESHARAPERFKQIFEGKVVNFESQHFHKDGSLFNVEVCASLVTVRGQKCILSVDRDITHRKISEKRLEENRQQLRALSLSLQDVREQERTRISRDIHDQLGQILTALSMDLRWLERKLENPVTPKLQSDIRSRISEAVGLTDQCVESVQRIAIELRPSALDQLGLAEAIRDEAKRYSARTGIECDLDLPEHLDPSPNQADTAFFRIFQELLTNVARHAKASMVRVALNDTGSFRTMAVCDDGVGMPEGVLESQKSVGLIGMKERASALGGSVEFMSARGRGTIALVRMPLARNAGTDKKTLFEEHLP